MSGAIRPGLLVLADGETFEGEVLGGDGIATGEVVFNTVLTGYQEVISDPSYAGQIITFTYPHIGNYGVTTADDEARRPFCRGVIVREPARRRSSWRSEDDLGTWLARHGIPALGGVDTRRLTRHLRDRGAVPGQSSGGTARPSRKSSIATSRSLETNMPSRPNAAGGAIPATSRGNRSVSTAPCRVRVTMPSTRVPTVAPSRSATLVDRRTSP